MNFLRPELLVLSGHIALLVLLASLAAFGIGWLWRGSRQAVAVSPPAELLPAPELSIAAPAPEDLAIAKARTEELQRTLAAAESQCIKALEQRDEAERQAALRASELHDIKAELMLAKDALQQSTEQARVDAEAVAGKWEQQLSEARASLDAKELVRAETRQEMEQLRQQLDKLQLACNSATAEAADLRQQLAAAQSLASNRQGQLERLARDKAESEIALKTQLDRLQAAKSAEPAAAPVPRTTESLFDESSIVSMPSDVPTLADAQAALLALQQDLEQKDFEVLAQTQERDSARAALETLNRTAPVVKTKLAAAEKRLRTAQKRLDEALVAQASGRRHVRAITRSLAVLQQQGQRADDLTRLKGVKTVINSQLHAFGIFTYRQIAQWDAEDIVAFSELLAFKNRIHRDLWQEQALGLHEAKYGERLVSG